MSTFEQAVTGIGALAEPVRRRLYLYVCAQPEPVGRDGAADALGIAHHQAKFHLDRLVEDGLLTATYARLSGRTGPGAGRPAKVYQRADQEIAVSLPGREYELAGRLMADAIAESGRTGRPVLEVLLADASELGRAMGAAGRDEAPGADPLEIATAALRAHGYEPRRVDGLTILANCPFHALAQAQTELVCHVNEALIAGLVDEVEPTGRICARLDPAEGRCCVVLSDDQPA